MTKFCITSRTSPNICGKGRRREPSTISSSDARTSTGTSLSRTSTLTCKKRLLGRFPAEVGSVTEEQVREQAGRIMRESLDQHRHELVSEILGQAKSNGRGVTGLRRVLRSLEMGEVQILLMAENYSAHAVECSNCGHLDAHMVRYCPVCGRSTRELEDVCEAIVPAAIRRDIELLYVKDEPELDQVGNIAALLRFRADQSKGGMRRSLVKLTWRLLLVSFASFRSDLQLNP